MTPDQLPAGLRVKALEWEPWGDGYRSGKYLAFPANGWLAFFDGALIAEEGWKFFKLDAAKAACRRHHEEQVCAQLEIENG